MSHVQQTCPQCDWERFVRVPETTDREFDDLIARHVGRSLQWEWQVHMVRDHPGQPYADVALTPGEFDDWVAQEGITTATRETPPGEGGGQTVRVNLPTITPEQARNLADAVERTMVSVADSVQRFAEHLVPTIHSAQEQLVNGLRAIVEQPPGRRLGCACNGGQGDHQPGQEGCLFRPIPADQVNLTQAFWRNMYGNTPVVQCLCDGTGMAHLRGEPGCLFLDAAGTLNPDPRPYGTVQSEVCSCCLRVQGEPHQFPNCDLAEGS